MRVKEAPAQALRAVFAGVGQVLGVTDRLRSKPAEAPAKPAAAAPAAAAPAAAAEPHVKVEAPETFEPESSVVSETAVPEPGEPETAVVSEAPAAEPQPAAVSEAAALPLANYDDLSIASLRARLRSLTPEQLTILIEYEKEHQGRTDVITMFERRIAKIAAGETTSFRAVK